MKKTNAQARWSVLAVEYPPQRGDGPTQTARDPTPSRAAGKNCGPSGKRAIRGATAKVGWGVLAVIVASGCARIKPDEIGVRTMNFGGGEGIVAHDYGPGYHRFLWPLDSWQRFPSTVQHIRFAKDAGDAWAPQTEALQITSADGDKVVMTAEVFFRIAQGEAHRVLQDSGPGERYRDVVRVLAQDEAHVLFGRLRTEAFYNPASRDEARLEAVKLLRDRLQSRGIELVDLLVEGVEFDTNYETLIKQKKLADQRVLLEQAKGRAATERGKVAKIAAETTVKVQKIQRETESYMMLKGTELNMQMGALRAEAEKYATGLKADAELYKSQREADGTRLLKSADAEGSRRLNEALVGVGGRNLAALEAVRKLNVGDVTFPSSGYEWFNPYEMAMRLGASGEAAPSPKGDAPAKP